MSNRQQKLEYSAAEQNCPGCMGPCGMCDTIETFLTVNALDLPERSRAKLRESAVKAIQDDKAPICTTHCPEHLRDAFRRIVIEAAYQTRVKGQRFDANLDYMPTGGKTDPRQSKNSRL